VKKTILWSDKRKNIVLSDSFSHPKCVEKNSHSQSTQTTDSFAIFPHARSSSILSLGTGNTKGGSITVLLISRLTGLESAV